ncbi:16S rRNA (guanine(527)-N(7))-methyltransferase RsmG [Rubrivivax sp. RP6-9]|uniref:16S rRNA (guanine(527)-N(7))-methyltransferase RsmG n=1 Tax=Rubrivivax sp. RP6-9 TaxID=3415750 RepID=UPI003CC6492D
MSAALDGICAALGLRATPAQTAALLQYLDLLQRWNGTYNLTAVRDPAEMLTQHLADCLALIPPLQRHAAQGRLLDVGSGGGLPGVVIAVMLPGMDVTCVDTVGKKAAFVRQVAAALRLPNLHAEHARVEQMPQGDFDVVTSRAFASLVDFTRWTRARLAPGGAWLAMKGKQPGDEIAALPVDVQVFHVEPLAVPGLAAQRCLVWMRPAAGGAPAATEAPSN